MNRINLSSEVLASAIKLRKEISESENIILDKNTRNNNSYLLFLERLLPEIPSDNLESNVNAKILHLGESHCLTFSHQIIDVQGKQLSIIPSLVKGAKAFHLSERSKVNIHKIAFEKRVLQNLDSYEHVFLSFGEIDCRADEGILLYCKKTGRQISDIARSTVKSYFEWTTNILSRYKDKLVYFGTPAPFKSHLGGSIVLDKDKQRLLAIRTFNELLEELCDASCIRFADVYSLTALDDGYNNGKWMIDSFHLAPKALNMLKKFN